MQVPGETLEFLKIAGVAVKIQKSGGAVIEFNRLQRECANIVAALHLTC